jgi:hypothetical protein
MPTRTSDQVIQAARQAGRNQIKACSQKAAQKIAARLSKGSKVSTNELEGQK